MRVLVVEDEQKVAGALRDGLESEGYEVIVEGTGEGAFFRGATESFDVILLDLGLPGRDGLQILQSLRQQAVKTPVLILTARDTAQDRVIGLDGGGDDYLVKPFAFAELLARVRALLRRGRGADVVRLKVGDLEIDLVTRLEGYAGQRRVERDRAELDFEQRHRRPYCPPAEEDRYRPANPVDSYHPRRRLHAARG
jgi:DNA-binding response OmpR family regulator